jgi:uncharacterized protein (TIGR03000 family)
LQPFQERARIGISAKSKTVIRRRVMLQNALKVGLIVVALGVCVQNASAFGRFGGCCWGGGGWGCCAPVCCPPVCGPVGCGWGGGYAYGGGWGYGGYAYAGYGGLAYGGMYLAGSAGAYTSPVAATAGRKMVSAARQDATSVLLTVNVPADAKVFVNGQPTTSTGERREYKSNNLKATETYAYRVRAEFVRDGQPVSEEQEVQLSPGQVGSFAFTAAPGSQVADMAKAARR